MADFEAVTLKWQGAEYKIRPNRMMQALAKVESVITFGELFRYLQERQTVPVYTVAMAFGALLRHTGASVQDIEVARELSREPGALDGAIDVLVTLLAPPDTFAGAKEGDAAAEENPPQGS